MALINYDSWNKPAMDEKVVPIRNPTVFDFGVNDVNITGNAVTKFALSFCEENKRDIR